MVLVLSVFGSVPDRAIKGSRKDPVGAEARLRVHQPEIPGIPSFNSSQKERGQTVWSPEVSAV